MKFLLLLICGLPLARLGGAATATHDDLLRHEVSDIQHTISSILARLGGVEKQNSQLLKAVDRLTKENDYQARKIDRLTQENINLNTEVNNQAQEIDSQAQEIKRQSQEIELLKSANDKLGNTPISSKTPEADARSQFTAFACHETTISMSCPNNRTLLVTTGNYGKYDDACSEGCCPPNPQYDCTELVEESSPQDWFVIKELCDNETSCSFTNPGSSVDECEFGYLADYMQLFYDCLPDDETGPVAFTASANSGSPTAYNSGDIVEFNLVLTNLGGHYNSATSSFICPVDGVYLMSVSMMPTLSDLFRVDLMRNVTVMGRTFGDDIAGAHSHTTSTVATECSRGEALWVRAGNTGNLFAEDRYSVFTGHLIQSL